MRKLKWDSFMTAHTLEKFLSYVETGPRGKCWMWNGSRDPDGYGHFRPNPQISGVAAHRFMFALVHGEDATNGYECVRHTCDTPRCVNPRHLLGGSHAENKQDAMRRGRAFRPQGEKHHASILTDEDVREIRRRYQGGELMKFLAEDYETTPSNISQIVNRRTWSHVK